MAFVQTASQNILASASHIFLISFPKLRSS